MISRRFTPAILTLNLILCCAFGSSWAYGQNLVLNGNFDGGDTGFISQYSFINSGMSTTPGTFGIRTNSIDFNSGYNTFADHTSGTGAMMLIDGSLSAGTIVWQEDITVATNKMYTFSGWVTAANNSNLPTLRFAINGTAVGADMNLTSDPGTWHQFVFSWNSETSTTASLTIADENNISLGNDFALDDLSFVSGTLASQPVTASIYTAVEIGFPSVLNANYQVQYTTALNTNTWVNLGSPVTGNGTTNYVFDSTRGQPQKFYRVQTLP